MTAHVRDSLVLDPTRPGGARRPWTARILPGDEAGYEAGYEAHLESAGPSAAPSKVDQ